ncbi:MAG: 40S ribosomal protein S25 [Candidatus Lokiarchaeota archaeon]|nr:40S ribosomal protein S25 [Candidatus Lokiarchaeota archaeon]
MPETKQVKLKVMYGKSRQINIIKRDLFIPKEIQERLEKEVPRMKFITPTDLSQKYGIRVSTADEFLKGLEKKHVIKRYEHISSPKIHVYVPASTQKK